MGDRIKNRMSEIGEELERRRKQLHELRFNYEVAHRRLLHVKKQIETLEEEYNLLSQGQLPLTPVPHHDQDY